MIVRQGWRWFGPKSAVSLDDIRQAGASDIVTALHETPIGAVWSDADVAERKNIIETTPAGRTPLYWSVVESIPIPDRVKREGRQAKPEIEAWIASMEALAKADIRLICYNFMPVVDWCRTEIDYETPTGSTAMRFDQDKYMAFELHILDRPGAAAEYSDEDKRRAKAAYDKMSEADKETLITNIAKALPGSTSEPLTIPGFRDKLTQYRDIDAGKLRQNLIEFLQEVTPAAEKLGVQLTLHPDDPPRPLFGLPRIASSEADYQALFDAVPSQANGMCFCTGSLGVRAENDLVGMARRFGPRIGFVHLRATRREADPRSFHEAAHLEGDVDMVGVIRELMLEDRKRDKGQSMVFRPDHGQKMLDDFGRQSAPGYPAIGRLRGLAEIRGIMTALDTIM